MASAAVISLKNTIDRLLNYSPQISIISSCRQVLESAYKDACSLQKILEELQSSINDCSIRKSSIHRNERAINTLNEEIKEAAFKFEDLLESHVANHRLISQSAKISLTKDFLDEVLMPAFSSLKEMVKKMEEEYQQIRKDLVSNNYLLEEDDIVFDFGGKKSGSNMVGLSDVFDEIKDLLTGDHYSSEINYFLAGDNYRNRNERLTHVSLVGMAGIGKTTIARKCFEDPWIQRHFQHRVFVTVGQKCLVKEIRLAILSQVNPNIRDGTSMTEEQLEKALNHTLYGVRYLIVLDDVWSTDCVHSVVCALLDCHTRSRVLVITRQQELAEYFCTNKVCHMRFLNKEESLDLLRGKVLGEHQSTFPDPQIAKAAEKITDICEGLPLAIIAVANLLSKARNQTPDHWNKAADKGISIFKDVGDDMYKVLISSYNYLSQYLKPCFLYMGAFPPKYEIPASKLSKMWIAEGLLDIVSTDLISPEEKENYIHSCWLDLVKRCLLDLASRRGKPSIYSSSFKATESFVKRCLQELSFSSDLILVRQRASDDFSQIKTCKLHSVYWHLCNREAEREKFLHVLNSYADGIEQQRRLCIHNNVLFGIEKVYETMESNISTMRSLLCTGPYHPYPLPRICFGSRLLRVLDALTIRFYNFPFEVVELVQLRYLALTYSGKIPSSISKLWNLEYLIVHRHLSIISSIARSCLPIEIWNMRQLRCVQVMGSDLTPHQGDNMALLSNLLTLTYMTADNCTREILEKIPNLKKLGIQIVLAPDDDQPFHCFDHLANHLHQLESLKCEVVNPNPRSPVFSFPASNFPSSLEKLSLSGMGYPWDYMRIVGQLPKLVVLKLRCYAFQGPYWTTEMGEFPWLKYLLLEDTDLVYWEAIGNHCFENLESITIRHCYDLKHIPASNIYSYCVFNTQVR